MLRVFAVASSEQPDWYLRLVHAVALSCKVDLLWLGPSSEPVSAAAGWPGSVCQRRLEDTQLGPSAQGADLRVYPTSLLALCASLAEALPGVVVLDGDAGRIGERAAAICRRAPATWRPAGASPQPHLCTVVGPNAELPPELASDRRRDLYEASTTVAELVEHSLSLEAETVMRTDLLEVLPPDSRLLKDVMEDWPELVAASTILPPGRW